MAKFFIGLAIAAVMGFVIDNFRRAKNQHRLLLVALAAGVIALAVIFWPSDRQPRRVESPPFSAPAEDRAPSCDRSAAQRVMTEMSAPEMSRVNVEDGWVVVRFGSDWASWNDRQTEMMVHAFADADACLSGRPRRIEFRSPTGKLVARADEARGIRMSQ